MKKYYLALPICGVISLAFWAVQIFLKPEYDVKNEERLNHELVFYEAKVGTAKNEVIQKEKSEKKSVSSEIANFAKAFFPDGENGLLIGYKKTFESIHYEAVYIFNQDDYFKAGVEFYSSDIDSVMESREAIRLTLALSGLVNNKAASLKELSISLAFPQGLDSQVDLQELKEELEVQLRAYFNSDNIEKFISSLNKLAQSTPLFKIRIVCASEKIFGAQRTMFWINQGIDKLNVQMLNLTF